MLVARARAAAADPAVSSANQVRFRCAAAEIPLINLEFRSIRAAAATAAAPNEMSALSLLSLLSFTALCSVSNPLHNVCALCTVNYLSRWRPAPPDNCKLPVRRRRRRRFGFKFAGNVTSAAAAAAFVAAPIRAANII